MTFFVPLTLAPFALAFVVYIIRQRRQEQAALRAFYESQRVPRDN